MSNAEATQPAPVEVIDPLDEVLQHTSEQAVRIANVDEAIKEVHRSITDLSEIMQAGLTEVRAAAAAAAEASAAQAGRGASAGDEHWRQGLLERLDELDVRSKGATRTHQITLIVVAVQALLVLLLSLHALGVFGSDKDDRDFGFADPTARPAQPAPAPAVVPVEATVPASKAAAPASGGKSSKKRHR